MARTGRRPGSTATREAILEAARRRFAESGFDGTSIRTIAADAGVDPALTLHFFGSKDALFRAALEWPFDPEELSQRILGAGPDGAGERLARTFLELWEDPVTREPLLALLRSSTSHPPSAVLLEQFVRSQLLRRVAGTLGGPDPELRCTLAVSHMMGIALLRHVLRIEPLASLPIDDLVARVTPTLKAYLGTGAASS
ncbi:MAG TPA: TetR family transcriptional regulator [Candidatus Dormibacteraeota bacterium]|jgi:AcrR family transcriptional regulator|nr:TetR family transcriptional regulator [Candidatus Dormibacteraeota bacterium]